DFTSVTLTSKANRSLTVTIPIGTYFSPGSSSVQNMVVREPTTVTLGANSSTNVSVKTACMNIRRSIPNSNNTFSAQSLDGNAKLKRVVALCNEKKASYAVTQAAVWIVTDNPGDNSLLNTLVYSDGRRAISSDDLAKAKEIVREAG
ncbi:MAG: thioester domain-containing protein, partial [Oscillospiraceae bacterium]|nr:thioester domain-containing protein [Oscillospiraceae bacterium]